MIGRKATRILADIYGQVFVERTFTRERGQTITHDKFLREALWNFLFEHNMERRLLNGIEMWFNHGQDMKSFQSFIMRLHLGDTAAGFTGNPSQEQREKAGQVLVKILAEAILINPAPSGAMPAAAISDKLEPGSVLVPANEYIYRFITPGSSTKQQYGSTSYYGWKLIFKDWDEATYVLTLPTPEYPDNPRPQDFHNLEHILSVLSGLKCHMYENALVPIALVNKLVSLSDLPSAQILRAFARKEVEVRR